MNFAKISLGAFHIQIFGIFAALAFLGAAWAFYSAIKKRALNTDFFVHHFWRWVLFGAAFGRLVAFFLTPGLLARQGVFGYFAFWDGGVHLLGALVGGLGFMLWDLRRQHFHPLRWVDLGVVPFFAGLLLLDIGAFVTGAFYGAPTSLPWGVTYNTFGVHLVTPLHPVSLYGFLGHYALMKWAQDRGPQWATEYGKLAVYGGGMWAIWEAFLQLFRGDETQMVLGTMRLEQLFFLLLGVGLLMFARRTYETSPSSPPAQ